jgi:hypothetical protein
MADFARQPHAQAASSSRVAFIEGADELALHLQIASLQHGTDPAILPAALLPLPSFDSVQPTSFAACHMPLGTAACGSMQPAQASGLGDELLLWDCRQASASATAVSLSRDSS